jgi:hypothetical protein
MFLRVVFQSSTCQYFFLYPRILSDCTCPYSLSCPRAYHMIVSCKQKNMAILFFTQQFITYTPIFQRVREKYFNYLSQSLTLCGVFIKDSTTNIINITPHAYNLFKNEWREANGLCCRVSLAKRGKLFPSVLVLLFSYTHSTKFTRIIQILCASYRFYRHGTYFIRIVHIWYA